MASRPTVNVYSAVEDKVVGTAALPAVFTAPIRHDLVQFVHTNMAKNSRQAYAVNRLSGMKYAAESWGTGRAVARIPRIGGGGTGTSGAGAFGNMCRGGRMFAPTKIYRRWHRRINLQQRRLAVVSALAATAVPSLVMSRGHKVENAPEIPLVVEDSIQRYTKTKEAVKFLELIGASSDLDRVNDSRQIRAGRGKMRNRRYVHRRGPMLVLPNTKSTRAFRNIFGLDITRVGALNLLHLAPGGHVGRFLVWTKDAFEQLDRIFGTFTACSEVKRGFMLPAPMLSNSDVTRVMQSEEVRRILKPKKLQAKKPSRYASPSNGIRNRRLRLRLNPAVKPAAAARQSQRNPKNRLARRKAKLARLADVKKMVGKNRRVRQPAKKAPAAVKK